MRAVPRRRRCEPAAGRAHLRPGDGTGRRAPRRTHAGPAPGDQPGRTGREAQPATRCRGHVVQQVVALARRRADDPVQHSAEGLDDIEPLGLQLGGPLDLEPPSPRGEVDRGDLEAGGRAARDEQTVAVEGGSADPRRLVRRPRPRDGAQRRLLHSPRGRSRRWDRRAGRPHWTSRQVARPGTPRPTWPWRSRPGRARRGIAIAAWSDPLRRSPRAGRCCCPRGPRACSTRAAAGSGRLVDVQVGSPRWL